MKRTYLLTFAVYLLIHTSVLASESSIQTNFMFWSRFTLGKVVASTLESAATYDTQFEGEWLETVEGGFRVIRNLSPYWSGRLNMGVQINAAIVGPNGYPTNEYSAKKAVPILLDATLEYKRGGLFATSDTLTTELGYFPFKYNPQSTNLGEYLFRSGTYPGCLVSGFEHSIDRPKLAGVHVSYVLGSTIQLRQDLIVNTELDIYPYRDINLTYIATPSFNRLFDFGLGVEMARLISVDPRKTSIGLDTSYLHKYDPKIGYIDTMSGDTIRYTFKGTKFMCRATFDFKELFGGGEGVFGKEDLKIYGEAALLGVKNYAGWYENWKERVPMMVGFNIPTFKLLDVFSIEIERYTSPYVNSQEFIWKGSSSVPYLAGYPSLKFPNYDIDWNDSLARTDDDIKWSIYASRRIGKYLRISVQAASDHTPKIWYTPIPPPQSSKYDDMVQKTKDWYFTMRLAFLF
jgi:hypothetical protein